MCALLHIIAEELLEQVKLWVIVQKCGKSLVEYHPQPAQPAAGVSIHSLSNELNLCAVFLYLSIRWLIVKSMFLLLLISLLVVVY